jgi:glycosyltransferase 2 family protein
MSRKSWLSAALIIAKLGATVFAFWLILRPIDIGAAARVVQQSSLADIGMAWVLLGGQIAINGVRWSILARSSGVALHPVEGIVRLWESQFFGQFTPSGVGGDAWRVYAVSKRGSAVTNAMNSVFLDRIIGVTALLLMVFSAFIVEVMRGDSIDATELAAGGGLALALAIGVLTLLAVQRLPDRSASWDRWGVVAACRRVSMLMGEELAKPRLLAITTALSVAGQILCAGSAWMLARAVGFDPSLAVCLVIVPLALLISMIPITIAGWGLREGVLAAGFVRAGASLEIAAAVSVLFGLSLALIGLTGGVRLWLMRRQDQPPELPKQDQTSNLS